MKKKNALFLLLFSLIIGACSDEDALETVPKPFVNLEVAEVYNGTQSPGDVWTWALDKEQGHMTATWDYGTFDDKSDDISIEGTFTTLPSGFLKVTITKAEPATEEIPTNGTAWFYAMEIPGMALVIKPEGSIKGDLIAMVPQGECADIPGTYNYIRSAPGDRSSYSPLTQEAFGYLQVTNNGSGGFNLSGYKWSLDCINGGPCTETGVINGIPTATCTGSGEIIITDGGDTSAKGQFTSGGTMMVDFGKGNGGAFALRASETANKTSLLNNTYFGLVYQPRNESNVTMPVTLSFFENSLNNMVGTGYPFTNIETNEIDNTGAVIIVEDVVNGRIYGTMNFDEDNDVSSFGGGLLVSGNDQILIFSSYNEDDNNPFILVLAKKN